MFAYARIHWTLVFQSHRVGYTADLFTCDGARPLTNNICEWASWDERVDEFAIKAIREFAQLPKRNTSFRFRFFRLVQRCLRDTKATSLLPTGKPQGLADEP